MKLVGNGIYLRFLKESDAASMVALNKRNRDFYEPYLIDRPEEFYTVEYQLRSIRSGLALMEQDQKYSFGVVLSEAQQLIGVVSLTEVVRGPLQSCWLGYYLDQAHNGHGYTTEAVELVVKYVFQVLGFHRVETGVMPHNVGSIRVLEKAGFEQEGLNKKNVLINGRWEDHLHFAMVNPVRGARKDEGLILSDLALRSKAVWGYDEAFLEACRKELTVTGEYIQSSEVFVIEPSDTIVGFYALFGEVPNARLDFLYVDPGSTGQGLGRMLWEHAICHARNLGYHSFTIDGDPRAEPFYLRMGAERIGEVPSGSIAGRMLPLLRYEISKGGENDGDGTPEVMPI